MTSADLPCYPAPRDLLRDKSVVISAAAGAGIGFAAAQRCLDEGASVTISDISERRLEEAAARLQSLTNNPNIRTYRCDVVVQADVEALFAYSNKELGRIDVVINNAGIGGDTFILDMTDEQWARVLDVSLSGTFRMTREAFRYMKPQGSGVVINIASVFGWRAAKGLAHYSAAKAGVMAFTRCAAAEAAEFGVRVNAVAPSFAVHEQMRKKYPPEFLETIAAREIFGRPAETWEIANVMAFLASDYSTYMSGETLSVSDQHA